MRVTPNKIVSGSPAGAGIDPIAKLRDMRREWFPRGCGDRPGICAEDMAWIMVPPRVRG